MFDTSASWISCIDLNNPQGQKAVACFLSSSKNKDDILQEIHKISPDFFDGSKKLDIQISDIILPKSMLEKWSGKALSKQDLEKYDEELDMLVKMANTEEMSVN